MAEQPLEEEGLPLFDELRFEAAQKPYSGYALTDVAPQA